MLVILTVWSCGCAAKKIKPMPEPIYGKDIVDLRQGQIAPFDGAEFSPFYLNSYLEWKCETEGKC